MPILISFKKSTKKDKKYTMVFRNPTRTLHFGSKTSKTFTEGGSEEKKKAYLKRHRVNEDWTKINAGSASRFILWGDSRSVEKNLQDYMKRFKIEDARKIPKQYIPESLSDKDLEKQVKSIKEEKGRPKVESFKSKRSGFVKEFEEKYKTKISDFDFIEKNILKKEGIKQILNKGIGAYYSSGSRPNQTPTSWSRARLASVIMNGPARKIDKKIWEKYKI
tara:strand:- start:563 stop:1222 length:660 start_codon:yes stop_codon:yes gene_type:complete